MRACLERGRLTSLKAGRLQTLIASAHRERDSLCCGSSAMLSRRRHILLILLLRWEAHGFAPSGKALLLGIRQRELQVHHTTRPGFRRCRPQHRMPQSKQTNEDEVVPTSEDPSLVVKAAWYGSELFGNLLGMGKSKEAPPAGDTDDPTPLPRQDAIARLKTDFDRFYFVTGQMDLDLYEEDCTFADPFVAFKGRERFKNNLDNLGSLMQDVSLVVTRWEEADSSIKTKWRFRCVLDLPWKPSLAASGGTEFFFSPDSGRIERHVESWDIKPMDALRQLVVPGRKRGER